MAISPRAAAPEGRGWTIVRPLGARAVPTSAALQALPSGGNDLVVVQTFRAEGDRTGDPVRDLRALMNLRNPNLTRIKEVVEKDGAATAVSQFIEGETLAALREQGPIPFGIELRILVDVLTGIVAMHGVKDAKLKPLAIVHGEIAPANVVIGVDGVPKIVQLCGVHAVPGAQGNDTVGWLAPEILLADDTFDQRVDVYGVGVMLWEALTGTTLFPETNAGAIVTRHLSGRIKKPTVPADAPWAEPFVDVAMKAIATDPGSRFATAADLASEIKRIAKSNLAPTGKVIALVKERGAGKIAARRAALGGTAPPKAATVSAPKPPGAKLGTPLAPTPKPPAVQEDAPVPDVPTVSRLVPEVPIHLAPHDGEDLQESAIKPVVAAPEPSVHDRTTTPSPVPDDKVAKAAEEPSTDFADFSFDSEPPPPLKAPPGPPPGKRDVSPFPAPEPFVFAEAPPPAPEPPPAFDPADFTVSPFPPVEPVASPAPFAEESVSPSSPRPLSTPDSMAPPQRRSPALWIGLGVAGLLVVIFSLRTCMTAKPDPVAGGAPSASAAKAPEPKPTEDPATAATAATAEPTATAAPTATAPTATATAEPTVAAAPTATEPPKADPPKADPPKADVPKPTPTGAGTAAPATKPTTTKPKPKAYDPQGI